MDSFERDGYTRDRKQFFAAVVLAVIGVTILAFWH